MSGAKIANRAKVVEGGKASLKVADMSEMTNLARVARMAKEARVT